MTSPIESELHDFEDKYGNPLSGTAYIGQPSTAPQITANQKTVTFTDSGGGSFTASQPLTIAYGKIVYNGQPIKATVDGEYSLLTLDQNGVQVSYEPSINQASDGDGLDLSETIRVGLTLPEIKALDVAVGDTVRNVGETIATDGLGADWLVVSATGSPGDDVDLIDFDNGLQGARDKSKVYRKEGAGTFILDPPVSVVSTNDATAYRNTWTNIALSSGIPTGASSAILRAFVSVEYPSSSIAANISSNASARKAGSSAAFPEAVIGAASNRTNANDIIGVEYVSEFTVALDESLSPSFDFALTVNDPTGAANNTTPDLDIVIVGYSINQE